VKTRRDGWLQLKNKKNQLYGFKDKEIQFYQVFTVNKRTFNESVQGL
jgi:hypothetical protein